MAPKIYNKILKSILNLSEKMFKAKLKIFLLSKSYYNVIDFLSDDLETLTVSFIAIYKTKTILNICMPNF